MLPFARFLNYGNIKEKQWYDGSIVAIDSPKIFGGTSTDYFGNPFIKSGSLPRGTTVDYGFGTDSRGFGGANTYSSDYVVFNTGTKLASLTTGWSLDYWYHYTGNVAFAYGHVLVSGFTDVYSNDYYLLCLDNESNFKISSNTTSDGNKAGYIQPTTVLSTAQAYYKPNTVQHLALMSDGTTCYLFINGVAVQSTTSVAVNNIIPKATGTQFGIYPQATYNINGRTIERFRLRYGVKFDVAGFDPNNIY